MRKLLFASAGMLLVTITVGPIGASAAPVGVTAQEVDAMAQALQAYGDATGQSPTFGGVVETGNASRVTVYLTGLDASVVGRYRSLAHFPDLVSFATTPASLAEQYTLHDDLTADAPELESAGVRLASWYPELRTGRETIEVIDPSDNDRQLLAQTLGSSRITIVPLRADQAPQLTANRNSDSSPRNGGTAITDLSLYCSSAFPVNYQGQQAMLSASHCFVNSSSGAAIYNYMQVSGVTTGSGAHIGDLATREGGAGAGDTAVYTTTGDGGSSNQVWTGVIGSPSLTTVAGKDSLVVGSPICNSGAYSGEVCNINVVDANVCVNYTGFRQVCHLDYANTSEACQDACIANQAGDSGGPVIWFNSSNKVLAAGVVSGYQGGTTIACQYNNTTCYYSLYFVPIDWALTGDGFNATLRTG